MNKSYTIQFEYNGKVYTRSGNRGDHFKMNSDYSDLAYNLVESVINAENIYVEGKQAKKIRLMGQDMELLWYSED